MRQTPILIIGAGPAGLTLSLELALYGIPHLIIESSLTRSPFSRALVLHSRTLELLSRHDGLVEQLLPLGKMNMALRIFANKTFVFESDVEEFGLPDTRFPTPLFISQAETERVLETYILEKGIKVERGLKAEKISHDAEGATVTIKTADDEAEEIRCQYLVGCDGSHSTVRKSTNLSFIGAAYPQDFILADLRLTWSLKECMSIFMGSYGFTAFFPMKDDVWRVLCSRVHERESDSDPTIADFNESIQKLVPDNADVVFHDEPPVWMTRFRLHHRIVDNYREGRCFLAGDAAHIHSPAGGQGMNTGMQDSINLAWKLAAVIKGENDDTLLDTYNIERHRIGEHLLNGTDRAFEFMTTSNPIYLWSRNNLVPWVLPLMNWSQAIRRSRFRFISELGVRYRHSPNVGQGFKWKSSKIRGGDRVPDGKLVSPGGELWLHSLIKESRYHLLLFSGTGSNAVDVSVLREVVADLNGTKKELECHIILDCTNPSYDTYNDKEGLVHDLAQMSMAGFVFVRPDGYVEFIGSLDNLEELKTWLEK